MSTVHMFEDGLILTGKIHAHSLTRGDLVIRSGVVDEVRSVNMASYDMTSSKSTMSVSYISGHVDYVELNDMIDIVIGS